MHELGLAESILDLVREYVPEADAPRVERVTVRIGDNAGVVAESLEFCFQAGVAGTPYANARLAIERGSGADLKVAEVDLADEARPAMV